MVDVPLIIGTMEQELDYQPMEISHEKNSQPQFIAFLQTRFSNW
jgi:hypothetical protein